MIESLNQIAKMIEDEANIFNEKYDKMVLTLLWIYRDEEKWRNVLWLRNFENEQFSNLIRKIFMANRQWRRILLSNEFFEYI